MLQLPAPAKLNLFLHITGRRDDGYHELQTCFQLLDYGDQLSFELTDSPVIELISNLEQVAPKDNLVYRAASLLQETAQPGAGVRINLNKRLPLGAGLGGGSSDAASCLLGLNQLWKCGLNTAQLAELGLLLGADVPVFVRAYSGWAEGVGEKLTRLELPPLWYVVITPDCQASTKEVFCHEYLTRNSSPINIPAFPFWVVFPGALSGTRNDCEAVAVELYPEIGAALRWLKNYAPARMSGTGSSVFTSFDTEAEAAQVLAEIPEELRGFIAKGVNQSPVLQALKLLNND